MKSTLKGNAMMNRKDFLNLILLNIARKEHNADWNWKGVNSPFARIYMVENGSAKIQMPNGTFIIEPGHIYLVPPFVTHGYENDTMFVLYYIHIYVEQHIFDLLKFPFEVSAKEIDFLLIKRLLEINQGKELVSSDPKMYDNFSSLMWNIAKHEQSPDHLILETKGILMQLFSRFLEKASSIREVTDERLFGILHYIQMNIKKSIKIEDLASMCHLTKDHFIRLFKKEMHSTPLQYINQKKIEQAQLMMVVGKKSIKDIAFELSFSDVPYFYRLFKKITGFSPHVYKSNIVTGD